MKKIKKNSFYFNKITNYISNSLSGIGSEEGFKKYFQNTGWLFFKKITNMFATFLVGIYITYQNMEVNCE